MEVERKILSPSPRSYLTTYQAPILFLCNEKKARTDVIDKSPLRDGHSLLAVIELGDVFDPSHRLRKTIELEVESTEHKS